MLGSRGAHIWKSAAPCSHLGRSVSLWASDYQVQASRYSGASGTPNEGNAHRHSNLISENRITREIRDYSGPLDEFADVAVCPTSVPSSEGLSRKLNTNIEGVTASHIYPQSNNWQSSHGYCLHFGMGVRIHDLNSRS